MVTLRGEPRVATAAGAGSGVAGVVGYSRLAFGRIAQRESARFTRGRSLVRSQVRPSLHKRPCVTLNATETPRWKRLWNDLVAAARQRVLANSNG